MDKRLLQELKLKLEKEKEVLERELKSFAEKDKKLKGDWDTRFPHLGDEAGGASLEKAADEVEEYSTRLPIEYTLEIKLKNVNLALEKIKKVAKGELLQEHGKYGICEKCGKPISSKRLKISPEARFCLKCRK